MILFALLVAPASACDDASTSSDLSRQVEAAETAYAELDIDGLVAATDTLLAALPCVSEPLSRSASANVHRVVGLRAFVDQEGEDAKLAFAAARSIQPDYRFPDTLIPPGNPILADYDAIPLSIASSEPAPALADDGSWRFDGRDGQERARTWPTVAQAIDTRGAVRGSVYLWPANALEAFDTSVEDEVIAAVPPPLPDLAPVAPGEGGGVHKGLLAGAGGMAILTGVTYALASSAASEYRDVSTPYDDLDGLRRQANTMTVGWAASAAVTAGLGASAFLVARW